MKSACRLRCKWPQACVALSLLGAAMTAHADVPTNKALIAAMPPATESVRIHRYDVMTSEGSVLQHESKRIINRLGNANSEEDRNRLISIVLRHVAMANLIVHIEGGSEFTRITGNPIGIGVGNYHSRSIWFVEGSLDQLKKGLAEDREFKGDVKELTLSDVPVYQSEVREFVMKGDKVEAIQEKRFVAIPTSHCVVITEDKHELEHILQGLKSTTSNVPEKWRVVAEKVEIESPIVVLRRFDPNNELDYYSPVNPNNPAYRRADIESFSFVMPAHNRLAFELYAVSKEPRKAAAFFGQDSFRQEVFEWKVNFHGTGFDAEVFVRDKKRNEAHPMLMVYHLFGPNVFI